MNRTDPGEGGGQPALPFRLFWKRHRRNDGPVFLPFVLFALLAAPVPAFAAGSAAVPVSAVILAASNCRFRAPSTTLDFALLDPANPVDVRVDATIGFRCNGGPQNVTFSILRNDGLYGAGPGLPRMRNTVRTTEFLAYGLALTPSSGTIPRNRDQTLTISGTVLGASYGNAAAGAYSDTITLSILP